jgi:hypothetical protein
MKSVCVYLFPLLVLTCYSQERSNVGEYNILDYGAKKDILRFLVVKLLIRQ